MGTVYVDKYELPSPYPKRIRVTVEPLEWSSINTVNSLVTGMTGTSFASSGNAERILG